jgi:hypothetical protein
MVYSSAFSTSSFDHVLGQLFITNPLYTNNFYIGDASYKHLK